VAQKSKLQTFVYIVASHFFVEFTSTFLCCYEYHASLFALNANANATQPIAVRLVSPRSISASWHN